MASFPSLQRVDLFPAVPVSTAGWCREREQVEELSPFSKEMALSAIKPFHAISLQPDNLMWHAIRYSESALWPSSLSADIKWSPPVLEEGFKIACRWIFCVRCCWAKGFYFQWSLLGLKCTGPLKDVFCQKRHGGSSSASVFYLCLKGVAVSLIVWV